MGQGGIARAVAFLKEARRRPDTVVVSGGDMVNRGAPLWSDVYGCVEWRWLAGLVDVWALGNHDLDYGPDALAACRAASRAPVLAANLVDVAGAPALTVEGKPYLVKAVGGVRLGFFALGGTDMPRLVRPENLPAGTRWADPLPVARDVVRRLRDVEKAMARAVPGIDLILGTHSHYKGELGRIGGHTAFISPFQYLAYVSEVELAFAGRRLQGITGRLAAMDEARPEDPAVADEVARLQRDLVASHPDRFRVVGRTAAGLGDEGVSAGESPIGNWATEVLRRAAGAHAYLATASSFRGGLPPGEVTLEDFYTAIPYTNRVVVAEMRGAELEAVVAASVARAGSDGFSQESGLVGMRALLERRPDLDAVFAASDLMAAGALQALREAGRRVPEDVAVVGYEDSPIAASTMPPLSSVRQPTEEMGREMARLLLAALASGRQVPRQVVLATELVVRESSAGEGGGAGVRRAAPAAAHPTGTT